MQQSRGFTSETVVQKESCQSILDRRSRASIKRTRISISGNLQVLMFFDFLNYQNSDARAKILFFSIEYLFSSRDTSIDSSIEEFKFAALENYEFEKRRCLIDHSVFGFVSLLGLKCEKNNVVFEKVFLTWKAVELIYSV